MNTNTQPSEHAIRAASEWIPFDPYLTRREALARIIDQHAISPAVSGLQAEVVRLKANIGCARHQPCSARDRFEAWITAPPFEKDIARSPYDQTKFAWPGQYRSYEVQLAWEAWCEAAGIDPFAADTMLRERKQGGQP